MLTVALGLILTAASPAAATAGPTKMTAGEIRAYNASLSRDHPNFIRCERVGETGSLVRKRSVCRTNEEWSRVDDAGNREAREATEGLQRGWSNGKG